MCTSRMHMLKRWLTLALLTRLQFLGICNAEDVSQNQGRDTNGVGPVTIVAQHRYEWQVQFEI